MGTREEAGGTGSRAIARRSFLRWSTLATAGSALPRLAAPPFAVAGVLATGEFPLEETTIAGLRRAMESGRFTSRRIVEMYLARIEALDKGGPGIRSILEINPDATKIAAGLDEEWRTGRIRGALHGIPVLLKDNMDTADRMTTTAGSLALAGSIPPRDSHVAARLRQAGAVLLAKTNMSEWANFRSSQSSSGWSSRGGQALNPYALDRSPCGSSSGSASAVAANLAAAALGTETDGSIVCPAAANAVVGIKPTVGLVSRSGVIPIAHSQDTVGPIARTVADAATLLGAIVGPDPRDSATRMSRGRLQTDYTRFLDPEGLRGARLGVPREVYFGYSEETDAVIEEALAEMRRRGAVLVDPADIPTAREMASSDAELEVLLYEFKADLNAYLAGLRPGAPVRSLAEVIEFNERNSRRTMPYFGQDLLVKSEAKAPLTDRAYRRMLGTSRRLSRKRGIDAAMNEHDLDAIIAPTGSPPFKIDLVNGDHFLGGSSSPAAMAGYPLITVPAGYVRGLPVGITFMGRAFSEPTLIELAYAFEQATKFRRPPAFRPSLDPQRAP